MAMLKISSVMKTVQESSTILMHALLVSTVLWHVWLGWPACAGFATTRNACTVNWLSSPAGGVSRTSPEGCTWYSPNSKHAFWGIFAHSTTLAMCIASPVTVSIMRCKSKLRGVHVLPVPSMGYVHGLLSHKWVEVARTESGRGKTTSYWYGKCLCQWHMTLPYLQVNMICLASLILFALIWHHPINTNL